MANAGAFGCKIELDPTFLVSADSNTDIPRITNNPLGDFSLASYGVGYRYADEIRNYLHVLIADNTMYFVKAIMNRQNAYNEWLLEKKNHKLFVEYLMNMNDWGDMKYPKIVASFISYDIMPEVHYGINANAVLTKDAGNNPCCAGDVTKRLAVMPAGPGRQTILPILMRKIGDYRMIEIFQKNFQLNLKAMRNFFNKLQFFNCFFYHNDLHPGNIMVNETLNELSIIDLGQIKKMKESPILSNTPYWSHRIENLILNGDNYRPVMNIFVDVTNSIAQTLFFRGDLRYLPPFVGRRNCLTPFNFADNPSWEFNIKSLIYEIQYTHSFLSSETWNRLMNKRGDMYFFSGFLTYLAANEKISCPKLFRSLGMLLRHPNPIIRPTTRTIIKLLNKIIKEPFHKTEFTINFNTIMTLDSFLPETHKIGIDYFSMLMGPDDDLTDRQKDERWLTTEINKKDEKINYFVTIHMLESLLSIDSPSSWMDGEAEITWLAWVTTTFPDAENPLKNRLIYFAFYKLLTTFSSTEELWKNTQKNVYWKILEEVRNHEPWTIINDLEAVVDQAGIPNTLTDEPWFSALDNDVLPAAQAGSWATEAGHTHPGPELANNAVNYPINSFIRTDNGFTFLNYNAAGTPLDPIWTKENTLAFYRLIVDDDL